MSIPIHKLAVFRLGAMGDLLHLAPSLREIKARYPDMEIHLISSPGYRELVQHLDGVDRFRAFEKGGHWLETARRLKALADELKAEGIDGFVNLQPNLKTWLLARLMLGNEAKERTALYEKEKISAPAEEKRAMERRHAVEDFYHTFRALLDLPEKRAEELVPHLPMQFPGGKSPKEMPIGLIPGVGGKRANRAWPLENYAALARRLTEVRPGLHFVLIGGPEEAVLSERLMQMKDPLVPMINHCGKHGLMDTAKLMTRCRFIVGGDTGPLHMAAAVGTPLVAIYGPTALARTGPLGHQPILHLTPPESTPGWPCEEPTCEKHGGDPQACIGAITVDDALGACLQMLETAQEKPAQKPEEPAESTPKEPEPETPKTPAGKSESGSSKKAGKPAKGSRKKRKR